MPIQEKYTQKLGLGNLDVFLDTPVNDTTYFTIGNLAQTIGYGKHGFTIAYNDPTNSDLLLKNGTGILFEFVDANGETVFSELSDIPDVSGAATGYVWVKKDPLWIAQEIADGPLTLYVVGELDGVPEEFQNTFNVRSTFTYNIRKSFPNTSKIIFYDVPALEASASFIETQEEDLKPGYSRGYINVSSSFMQTHGGKVSFIELSYQETGSQSDTFNLLNTYAVEGPTSRFEIEDTSSVDGLNPLSHTFKMPIPRSIRRDTPVIFKLRYLDADKTPAKYYDENRTNQDIVITSSVIEINGSPMIIEQEDNLLAGSMYTGQAVGKGFEQSGKNSAYLKTVDYEGFISASTHIGKSGIMFFSGSVLPDSGDDYKGVGLEMVGDSESLFRFRSSPSLLDIKTREFFVGSSNQFISASQGKIEISSSRFHLDPTGNVSFSGSIDASSGRIGGFKISSSRIHSEVNGREDLILNANGQISASALLIASSSFQINLNNLSRFGEDGFQSFVMADDTGVRIQTSDFNLNTARFIISSSDVGVMAMGSTPPSNWDDGKGIYMSGDGEFLAGSSIGERIQFNGFNLVMSSSAFFLGNQASFMSGSEGKIRISGSDISIQTPQFFFGDATKFISGSNGNLEITSSRFHLDRDGNVKLIGRIEAESGFLGGFGITQDAITGSNIVMSGSPEIGGVDDPRFMFISASNFNLKENGDITGSAVLFSGGTIGGFELSSTQINSRNDNLILKDSGQITGSNVLFSGGKIAAFRLTDDALSTDSFFISASATDNDLFISASSFNVTAQGIVTASALSLEGGDVGGLHVAEGTVSVGEILKLKDSGQITGSQVLFTGGKISGSDLKVEVPTFFLGSDAQFVSGSNGNIEITSSNFHLDRDGTLKTRGEITATAGTIGGFTIGSDLSSTAGTLKLKGATGQITASDAQISGKITAETGTIGGFNIGDDLDSTSGTLKLKGASGQITASDAQITGKITAQTGTIGGFNIGTNLESSGGTLNLKGGSGQITGSRVLLSGGEIGGFDLSATQINSTNSNLLLKSSGQITGSTVLFTGGKISGSALDIIVPKFFLGSSEQFISGSNGNIEISSSDFHLDRNGSVNMSGTVTATAGKIAGWTISGNTLVGANATLDGAGSALFKTDQGPGTDSGAAYDQLRDEYYIDFTPTQGPTNSAGQFYVKFGPNFSINNDGVLFASGAQFEGTISASKGIIGGFTTDANAFSSPNLFISGSPGIGGINHPKYMFISSSNFNVKQNGDVTGSQVLFTGGKVGGWVMDDATLTGGTVTLNSAGSIKVGTLADATTTATTNSGFFADNSGNVLIKGNVNNNDYLKISAGGGIDIRSQVFDLDAGTMILDSATRSGTIALGATPNINIDGTNAGVYMNGLGDFLVRVDANNFIKVDQDATPKLLMKAQTFFLGGDSQFVSGSLGNIEISSSNFHLDAAGNVDMSGTITATAGKIAGFTISGDSLTATNFEIDASGKRITLGDASSTDLFVADADEGIQLGNNTFGLAPFSVTKGGVLKAVAGTIGGFGVSATTISSSNDNLILRNNGQITGSQVLFTGGDIGGFTINATTISSSNFILDAGNERLVLGSNNKITMQGGGTDNFITMGSKTAFAQSSTAGIILGMDNNVPSFDLTRNATNYVRFDTSTGVDIKTDTFKLDTTTLDIDSSTSRIQVVNDSSNEVIRFGEISDSASDLYGIKVYDGSGTADSNILVKLGGEGNTIGGWTITNDQIQSDNLIIHSSGRLETADFASGVKGWRISSEGNGQAEFENATIRGTLKTAVFEKETVNAVGGQLYVANSTALTGSGVTSASFTTMSVENVSGFVQGEILSLKKVSPTGFATEYVLVNSSSRDDRSSDTNFAGKLMVTRGYGRNTTGDSGSLGGSPATSQSYDPGQVLVSTGKVGTGYIRLNANPNDQATPYMDIVERTGTGIYDIDLKVRVGDLSGLSSATLFGNANPGFGIFTENGFFKGGINATTGSFTGVVHINTSANEVMKLGTNVRGTDDGIHINNNNYWYTDSQFKVGDANSFILHDGAGDIKIVSENFTLKGGSKLLMTTQSLAFDTSNASTATRTAGTGIFMSSSGDFRVGNSSGNRLTFSGTSLELVTSDLNIDTSTFDLSTDGTGKIALGATPPTGIGSGTGFFVDGAGNFLAGNASGNFIRFNQSSGAVQVSGEITITAGALAGVTKDSISGSNQSGLSALEAGVSASIDNATGSLSSSLATAIGVVSSSAGQGISSANTATAAASTAQSAIDDMETQVVLNSGGMDLRNESNLNLVSYGTTTKFFDGVGQTDAHQKLRLNTDGVFAFANTTQSFARFYNQGVQIVSGGIERAKFAETTTIGNTAFEHVEITETSLKLKDGSTVRLSMDSSGMQIGSVSNGITLNAGGDATFNGTITLPAGTVSGSGQVSDITGSLSSSFSPYTTQVVLSSDGMALKSADGSKTLADYGTTVTIGENADDKSRMVLDNNSLDLIVDAGGTDTTHASFGATTTIGPTATEHIEITSTSLKLKDGNSGSPITHITINSSGMQIGSVSDGITLDTSGNATFNGTITLPSGTVSGSGQVSDITGSLSASLAPYETQVELSSAGMALKNTGGDTLASYGTTITIGQDANDKSRILIDNNSVDLIVDDSGVDTTFASFGAITTVGNASAEHVRIDSDSVDIIQDANNKAVLNASGLTISQSGAGVAKFAGTTTIGNTANEHLLLNTSGLAIKDGTTQRAIFAATSVIGSSTDKVTISDSGLTLRENNVNTLNIASGVIDVGDTSNEHLRIDTTGLLLKDNTNVVGKFVQGGATIGKTDGAHISASTTDVSIIRNNNNKAVVSADGMKITQGGTEVADFGSTVVIGEVGSNKSNVQITSGAINLRNNTTNKMVLGADGSITIGNQFSVNSDGDATFGGTLTIGGLVSGSAQLADAISGSSNAFSASAASSIAQTAVDSASVASSVQITNEGLNILNSGNEKISEFGANVFVGLQDEEHVKISSDGLELKDNNTVVGKFVPGGATIGDTSKTHISASTTEINILQNGKVSASFGTTTTIGSARAAHTFIDSGSFRLKDGTTERLVMDAKGIRMGSQFSVAADGTATFGGTLTVSAPVPAGTVSGSAQLADAISGSSNAFSASAASSIAGTLSDSASMASAVQLTATGLNVLNDSSAKLAEFGANVFVGLQDAEHIKLSSAGLELKDNNDVVGKFVVGGATLGKTTGAHVSASTTDVHIIQDANNKAVVDAGGLTVIEGGNTVAQFAATTVIGSSTDKVTINDSGITIRENNFDKIQLVDGQVKIGNTGAQEDKIFAVIDDTGFIVSSSSDEDGHAEVAKFGETTTIGRTDSDHVKITSQAVSIKTDANTTVLSASAAGLAMSGRVTATSGEIGGFTIDADEIKAGSTLILDSDTNSGQIKLGAATSLTAGDGIYMDGTGDFRAGDADGNRISFDGTNLQLISDKFFLGGNSQFVSGSNNNIEISSSGFHLKPDGSALFAGGAIELQQSGDIVSQDFLIEKTRLFGFGVDGIIVLDEDDCTVSAGTNGGGSRANSSTIRKNGGGNICTRDGNVWTMQGDWYTHSLFIRNDTVLCTNGFRLFVFKTLTLEGGGSADARIHNNGFSVGGTNHSGSNGTHVSSLGGAGAPSGTLTGGVSGSNGGSPSVLATGGQVQGGNGGGAGGSGGIVMIFARNIQGDGQIEAKGGNGGKGSVGNDAGSEKGGSVGGAGSPGGAGGASEAVSRVDVMDPHLLVMMRDVMDSAETAARLNASAGAGGGGAGGNSAAGGGGGAGGQGGNGLSRDRCIVTTDGGEGGTGMTGGSRYSGAGGGGAGGTGGVVVIVTTSGPLTGFSSANQTGNISGTSTVSISANHGVDGQKGEFFPDTNRDTAGQASGGTPGQGTPGKLVFVQV